MYEQPLETDLSQGDILDDCPILVWKPAAPPLDLDVPPEIRIIRVVVLTQACDLAQDKTTRVVVAPVHDAAELVARVPVHSGLDGVMHNGVGAQRDIHRWLIIGPSHHGPLSTIPTAQGPPRSS